MKYFEIYESDRYNDKMKTYFFNLKSLFSYYEVLKRIQKKFNLFGHINKRWHYFFYLRKKQKLVFDFNFIFDKIYNYKHYKHLFNYKYKIPTMDWSILSFKRRVPKESKVDSFYLKVIDEEHPFESYQDSAAYRIYVKNRYNYKFLYRRYPYNTYIKNKLINYFNYYKIINNNFIIIKKFKYIKGLRERYNRKIYVRLLEKKNRF